MAISDRGFASMPEEKQRKIARMGGQASAKSRRTGAAGRTAAAKRGGKNSSRSGR